MCKIFLPANMNVSHMACLVPVEPDERAMSLELDFQMLVSHHVGIGNLIQVSRKGASALNYQASPHTHLQVL